MVKRVKIDPNDVVGKNFPFWSQGQRRLEKAIKMGFFQVLFFKFYVELKDMFLIFAWSYSSMNAWNRLPKIIFLLFGKILALCSFWVERILITRELFFSLFWLSWVIISSHGSNITFHLFFIFIFPLLFLFQLYFVLVSLFALCLYELGNEDCIYGRSECNYNHLQDIWDWLWFSYEIAHYGKNLISVF